jgi:putative transcriptional regulator
MQTVNLTHHFMIAMPALENSVFSKTILYVCEHNEQGALGLVINRPIDLQLSTMLQQINIQPEKPLVKEASILFGGPVQVDCGFVLHHPIGKWQSTLTVNDNIGLTTSLDILKAIANDDGPQQILVTLGYAGWAPGQIEHELAQNTWLTVPASSDIIFNLPAEKRLSAAMELLGIDFSKLSHQAGHA